MSVFSRIQTEYGEILRISLYSVRMQENTDQKKLRIWTLFTQCSNSRKCTVLLLVENALSNLIHPTSVFYVSTFYVICVNRFTNVEMQILACKKSCNPKNPCSIVRCAGKCIPDLCNCTAKCQSRKSYVNLLISINF